MNERVKEREGGREGGIGQGDNCSERRRENRPRSSVILGDLKDLWVKGKIQVTRVLHQRFNKDDRIFWHITKKKKEKEKKVC